MNEEKIKAYSAWFESELALHKIAKGFLDARVITQYHMDCENKYEWFVGDTENDFDFNVSKA